MNYKIKVRRFVIKLDYIWFQLIKIITPLVWRFLPLSSQKDILQDLWAWQEVLKFRKKDYSMQVEMQNLVRKLSNK